MNYKSDGLKARCVQNSRKNSERTKHTNDIMTSNFSHCVIF